MNFLAPAFFAGLAAIAVPVLIHLINRERKVVVEFPSLMFLQRIPYRSVRRQKIRPLMLLILRCLAVARREVVLISDYQKVGWVNHNGVVFPQGTKVTPVDLGGGTPTDVAVAQVTTDRDSTGDRDRVTVAARLINTSAAPRTMNGTLSIGGRDVQTRAATLPASSAQQVTFVPVVVPTGATRGVVRIAHDSLPQDD